MALFVFTETRDPGAEENVSGHVSNHTALSIQSGVCLKILPVKSVIEMQTVQLAPVIVSIFVQRLNLLVVGSEERVNNSH